MARIVEAEMREPSLLPGIAEDLPHCLRSHRKHAGFGARQCLQHLDRIGRQPDRVVDDLSIGAQTGTGIGLQ